MKIASSENASYPQVRLPKLFEFEKNFDDDFWVRWMEETGMPIAVTASVVYVIAIFGLRSFMENRERKEFRSLLVIWNLSLAIFSILGTWRMYTALSAILSEGGWHKAACDNVHFDAERISGFWLFVFTSSKLLELGDTVFVVFRKSKLIFLHWYHHIFTMCYCCWGYSGRASTAFLCTLMNFTVHSLMYTYYALRAAGVRVPKQIAMVITTMQITQMVLGTYIYFYAHKMFSAGIDCEISVPRWRVGALMYVSFLVLFANFFFQVYIVKKPKNITTKMD